MARSVLWLASAKASDLAWASTLFLLSVSVVGCGGSTVSELSGPTPARCDTSLTGVPAVVGASGAQLQVSVLTSRDCVWSLSGGASWVQVSPRTGQGESTVTLEVAPNPSPSSRVTTVAVNERTVNIVQDAAPPPPPAPGPAPSPAPQDPGPAPSPAPPGPAPAPSPSPTRIGSIELDGRVSAMSGSCPNLSFTLRGRQVLTTPQTRFNSGNCRDMRNGLDVDLEGDLYSDGTVRATRIQLDD